MIRKLKTMFRSIAKSTDEFCVWTQKKEIIKQFFSVLIEILIILLLKTKYEWAF